MRSIIANTHSALSLIITMVDDQMHGAIVNTSYVLTQQQQSETEPLLQVNIYIFNKEE